MSIDFWINVGVLAAIYGIFSLGLQLNVGFTGLANFGQAGEADMQLQAERKYPVAGR